MKYDTTCSLYKLNGRSGNKVYMVKNNENNLCVAKIFNNRNDFISEASSYIFFKNYGFDTVNLLFTVDNNHFIIFIEVAKGRKISDLIKDKLCDLDTINRIGYNIGKTLRKIHDIISVDTVISKITTNKLRGMIKFTNREIRIAIRQI